MDEAIDEAIRERSKALLDSSLAMAAGIHYSAPRQKEARALFERLVQENRVQDLLDAAIEEGERGPPGRSARSVLSDGLLLYASVPSGNLSALGALPGSAGEYWWHFVCLGCLPCSCSC